MAGALAPAQPLGAGGPAQVRSERSAAAAPRAAPGYPARAASPSPGLEAAAIKCWQKRSRGRDRDLISDNN